MSLSVRYSFTALAQRLSNCTEIQNTILNFDQVLKILICGSLMHFDAIQYIEERVNWP